MYTPEQYTVRCGVNENSLDHASQPVEGTIDILASDVQYIGSLDNLRPFTQYFCRIVSNNTVGVTEGNTTSFTTQQAGM